MHRTAALLVLLLALAGCSFGGASPTVETRELQATVLQQEDLPDVFVSFDEGPLQQADSPRGQNGWKARYRRAGSPATTGPLVIESRVDRVADAEAAERVLAEVARRLRAGGADDVEAEAVGEEAFAFRQREEAVNPVELFTIAWREANVVASITISGFAGKVTVDDALELARKQERRVADAA